jgi:SAM-dependent methyltransferase
VCAFLRALHGGAARTLREDFCGSAAAAIRWIRDGRSDARAIGVDLDRAALARASRAARDHGVSDALTLLCADCLDTPDREPSDIVWVGNFSVGYLHTRADLMRYLRASRERLDKGHRGVLALDTYGGAGAFRLGGLERTHPGRGSETIRYAWRHEEADALTGMVTNSISFRVEVGGEIVAEYPRAFVYRWRLWSIAELRDAMREAGFASTEVYSDVRVATGDAPSAARTEDLGEDWIVVVAARVG